MIRGLFEQKQRRSGGKEVSNKIIKDAKLNTASKTKKVEPKKMQPASSGVGITPKGILLTLGGVLVLLCCIFVGYDMFRERVILTVNEEKYTMSDVGYYVYQSEAQAQFMQSLYAQYDPSYNVWDTENVNTMMDETMDAAQGDLILYMQAVASGYEATEEDEKTAKEQTASFMENLTKKQTLIKGLSEKEVYQAILRQVIGKRYKADQIVALGLNYDEITKEIKKEDYKQYDFQYYYVSTTKADETTGESVDVSDEEKKNLKAKMEDLLVQAKSTEDFKTLLSEEEEVIKFVESGKMIEKDGFDEKLDSTIKKLKKDEISEVLETEDGYYIIKLVDNASTESYDTAIADAKTKAEEEAFEEKYNSDIVTNYNVDVNYDEWDEVPFGNYSI